MSYPGDDDRLPVIYVLGFADNDSAINSAVDAQFYGFSQCSVHVRTDSSGRARFHQSESPLLRLISGHKYEVPVHCDQWAFVQWKPARSAQHRCGFIVFTMIQLPPFQGTQAALDLFEMVKLVLEKTGAPKVFLVGNPIGGLIFRSLPRRPSAIHLKRTLSGLQSGPEELAVRGGA
ncbi:hypothetical protein [Arthrobacter sp. D1-17]